MCTIACDADLHADPLMHMLMLTARCWNVSTRIFEISPTMARSNYRVADARLRQRIGFSRAVRAAAWTHGEPSSLEACAASLPSGQLPGPVNGAPSSRSGRLRS